MYPSFPQGLPAEPLVSHHSGVTRWCSRTRRKPCPPSVRKGACLACDALVIVPSTMRRWRSLTPAAIPFFPGLQRLGLPGLQ